MQANSRKNSFVSSNSGGSVVEITNIYVNFDAHIMDQFRKYHKRRMGLLKQLLCDLGLQIEIAIYALLASNAKDAAEALLFLFDADPTTGLMQHEFISSAPIQASRQQSDEFIKKGKKRSKSFAVADPFEMDIEMQQRQFKAPLIE